MATESPEEVRCALCKLDAYLTDATINGLSDVKMTFTNEELAALADCKVHVKEAAQFRAETGRTIN
jgi:hypothetical protein